MSSNPPTTSQDIIRPIYLVPELGEYARLPDGAIINAGGVAGPNFLVNGRALLFADGTATDGSIVSSIRIDFQGAYENSLGEAFIDFTAGKDLVLQAVNRKQFRFDADTGDVTISGNLTVIGNASTTIDTTVVSDRVTINQISGDYTPFIMEPRGGVVPTVNLADIKVAAGGASVFTIGPNGTTYIQALTVGLVNGVDIGALQSQVTTLQAQEVALRAELDAHKSLTNTSVKHTAQQISVKTDNLPNVSGSNVQEAIESISSKLTAVSGIRAYEHIQSTVGDIWTVQHNANTKRVQITLWDSEDECVFADTILIKDANTVVITFNTPITGRAILMLF